MYFFAQKKQCVTINWSKEYLPKDLKKHRNRPHEHLYLIVRRRSYMGIPARKIQYIGMAYDQTPTERLKDHHKLPTVLKKWFRFGKITIRFGKIILPNRKRMTETMVRDIEAALIYTFQPKYNEMSKSSYRGRSLEIHNRGRNRPLPKCFEIKEK